MHTALPLILALSAYTGLAAAWTLAVSYGDGTTLHYDGFTASGCKQLEKTDANVNSVHFERSARVDTFKLFHDEWCNDLGYKGKEGVNNVPSSRYASYEVY